jgi:recombinational DNA repair ATPase RecF
MSTTDETKPEATAAPPVPLDLSEAPPRVIAEDDPNASAYTLTKLEIVSFKRIKVFRMSPEGETVVIGGWNKQGKSSVLDAIRCLLSGSAAVPAEPIHRGKRSGRIHGTFTNKLGEHFTAERTFSASGGTELHVRDADGETPVGGAQTFLVKLMGGKNPLAFDPSSFILMDDKQQDAICRQICGLDFSDLNANATTITAERKAKNAEVEKLKVRYADMPEHADAGTKEKDPTELSRELTALHEQSRDRDRRIAAREAKQAEITAAGERLDELERQLMAARQRYEALGEQLAELPEPGEPVDVTAAEKNLETLTDYNRKVRANLEKNKAMEALEAAKAKSEELSERLEDIATEKAKRLSEATYPVPGMSFDEVGPTLNGFPIKQASDREQIELGVAIAFAQNPQLRIALVRAGSFFDPPALRVLADEMKRRGGQAWVEVVRTDDCDVVMQDGEPLQIGEG